MVNGDKDKSYWVVTTSDGMQYYFGQHQVTGYPTGTVTNSVFTVPVADTNSALPCYISGGFANGATNCDRGWRWNLDYVVDTHGNAMTLWYAKETNYYARNGATTASKPYVRGGYLTRIDYGQRTSSITATPPMQVVMTTAERCLANCSTLDSSTKGNWPDVPFDQVCAAGATCTKVAPTFFSRRRLYQITTKVLKGAAYQDVDFWQTNLRFPAPGDGSPGADMWLESITHTGKVTSATAPALSTTVSFDEAPLPNRVDYDGDGIWPMVKLRVGTIFTETGARITVNYAQPECWATATSKHVPTAKDNNAMRCFPVKWTPPNSAERDDWFHRHVVEQVRVNDVTGGGDTVVTSYTYSGGAAWHYQDTAVMINADRTWSEWRGFKQVTTSAGDPAQPGPRSKVTSLFFRGMNGDKKELAGSTRSETVVDSKNVSKTDDPELAGQTRETITYESVGSDAEVSGVITDYWAHQTAAVGDLKANFVQPSNVQSRVVRDDFRAELVRTTATIYNPETGLPIQVNDFGDSAKVDETCTITNYVQSEGALPISYPSRVVSSTGSCDLGSGQPPKERVLSDVRHLYDNKAFNVAPTKGDVTATQRLNYYDAGGVAQYQTVATNAYDALGRRTSTTDAVGRVTSTAYTPATGGALSQTVVTQPAVTVPGGTSKSFTTTTTYLPEWGVPSVVKDQNDKLTELTYDSLGRRTAAWLPSQSKAGGELANTKYTYSLSSTAASWVRTETLNTAANGYVATYALFDALLRPRQTQRPAVGSGRVIAETKYDTRGLAVTTNADVWDSSAPSGTLANVLDASVPNETLTAYDGVGRETVSTFAVYGQPKWSTRKQYGGDTVTVLPPAGATATTEFTDVRGQVVAHREYDDNTETAGYVTTSYTFDLAGRLTDVASAGSTWQYEYDLQGRKVRSIDPDAGTTTMGYDAVDRLVSTTNANQKTLLTTYDNLDRKVSLHEGSKTDANLRAEWLYDVGTNLGQLYRSTRYTAGKAGPAYLSSVTSRNELYKPTETSITIPAAEGTELDGTYVTTVGYKPDAETVAFTQQPGGGALGLETLQYDYNPLGLPISMHGTSAMYVMDLAYTPFGEPELYKLGVNNDMFIQNYYEDGTRRLKQTMAGDVTIYANHSYSYDSAGNLLRNHNLVGSDTQCFDYDGKRRLTEAWTPANGDCSAARDADLLGGAAPYWQSWTYTASGLRRTQTTHATAGATTQTYNYDSAQPHALDSVATAGAAPKPTANYDYDPAGNTTGRPGGGGQQTLTWDAEGDLRKLTEEASSTDYVYDAEGNLLLRKNPGKTTLYVGALELTLDTATRKVVGQRHYALGGKDIAVRDSWEHLTWLVSDYHNTSHVAVDQATLAGTIRFTTPFGETRGPVAPTWPDNHGFLGKPDDTTTGLTHIEARDYDPSIGRFISVDPIMVADDPQSLLGYAYANNNPTSMWDPTGLQNQAVEGGGNCQIPTGCMHNPEPPEPTEVHEDDDGNTAQQVGVTNVVAPDRTTYYRAYEYAKKRMNERRKGWEWNTKPWGFEMCTNQNDSIPGFGGCGGALAIYANQFGKAMCEAPGMMCGDVSQSTIGQAISMAAAAGMFGGKDGSLAAGGVRKKTGPKPFMSGPHNLKIKEVADGITDGDVIAGGQTGRPERVWPTPGGVRTSRRPDILVRRPDGSYYGINVGLKSARTNAPIPREVQAINDLERAGLEMHFVPYN